MDTQERNVPHIPQEAVAYAQHLRALRAYVTQLELPMPQEAIRITFPTGHPEHPVGALLPLYGKDQLSTHEGGFQRVLFNLRSLTGFVPPTRRG